MQKNCVVCGETIATPTARQKYCRIACKRQAWRNRHRVKLCEKQREYYYANQERMLERNRAYRASDPIRNAERCRAYREEHPGANAEYLRDRYRNKHIRANTLMALNEGM